MMSEEYYYCQYRELPWRGGACAHVLAKCDSCQDNDERRKLMDLHEMGYCPCCGGPLVKEPK